MGIEFDLLTKPPRAQNFIPRIASDLEVSNQVCARAVELAKMAEDSGLANGCHPSGFAAACLYLAGQEYGQYVTQEMVADAGEVSKATVRTHRDKLKDYLR